MVLSVYKTYLLFFTRSLNCIYQICYRSTTNQLQSIIHCCKVCLWWSLLIIVRLDSVIIRRSSVYGFFTHCISRFITIISLLPSGNYVPKTRSCHSMCKIFIVLSLLLSHFIKFLNDLIFLTYDLLKLPIFIWDFLKLPFQIPHLYVLIIVICLVHL